MKARDFANNKDETKVTYGISSPILFLSANDCSASLRSIQRTLSSHHGFFLRAAAASFASNFGNSIPLVPHAVLFFFYERDEGTIESFLI